MNLDPRIIEGKRVLTPFDIDEAEQFNGQLGYFSNVTDDFRHLENAVYRKLDLTFGEKPYCFIGQEGDCHACLYFLPDEWVREELHRGIVLGVCYDVKKKLADLYGKQNLLLNCICSQEYGRKEPGDKSMVWHMRDTLKKAYDDYRALLNDFEKGNY